MEFNNLNLEVSDARVGPRLLEKCPRCNSMDTKFCYYNNYSLNQPRHYCKTCRRYWTQGGICRNIPVGGSSNRKNRRAVAHRRVAVEPYVSTSARGGRRRFTNAGSTAVSSGRGRERIISSTCVNFPNELKFRVSEFGHPMSSLGSMLDQGLSLTSGSDGPPPLLPFDVSLINYQWFQDQPEYTPTPPLPPPHPCT